MTFDPSSITPAKVLGILQRLRLPLLLVAIVILCYQVGTTVYYAALAPSFQGGEMARVRIGNGERWAWFNAERKPVAKPQPKQENITESRINATLKGIIALGDRSVAVITLGGRQEKDVFAIGDKLKGNTTIEAIESNRVLIRENGQLRSLTMEENDAGLEVSASSKSNIPAGEGVGKSLNEVAGINAPVLAGITFVQTDSGDTGMSLGTINPQMLEGTDLQADDVVLTAGGNTIEQIMSSPTSYQSLLRSDSLDITVMRGGEEQVININPRSIAPNIMRMIGQNR